MFDAGNGQLHRARDGNRDLWQDDGPQRSAIPAWNPLFGSPHRGGLIFSNIWLVLAVLQVASLGLFYFVFGRRRRAESSETWLITA
ncbi:hypothetical protein [Paenibacillus glucanolyticus]|uniref:hypothetical protein n=1 Tax=Paenibacillus glucanolyticus TaxID=59843 RepID=UPI0018D378C8|nr:hypothetical protein [Paenibacillus glucanolyticus]